MFSRIELARSNHRSANDGRLEVHELLGLRIRALLVFLSGCDTAVGLAGSTDFAPGEDFATLAQAFLFAGTETVIATLWPIEDRGAAEFALRFYLELPGASPADAVASVQRALIEHAHYSAPYHWASYQVAGGSGVEYPAQ